jgi:hypothetical protein
MSWMIARPGRQVRDLGLGEEREGALLPQAVEDGVPLGRRAHPEVAVGEIDAEIPGAGPPRLRNGSLRCCVD